MIQKFLEDPYYALLMSFIFLAILIVLTVALLLIKDMIESPWQKRCQDLTEQAAEKEQRLTLLASTMSRAIKVQEGNRSTYARECGVNTQRRPL